MRRLASAVAAAACALFTAPASAEPFDLDLAKLGAPDHRVWQAIEADRGFTLDEVRLASEAKQRFAVLSTETALALSSAILQPASTTGHSGFAFDMEVGYIGVHPAPVGSTTVSGYFEDLSPWQTRSGRPHELLLPSIHVRKALPFSFEMGGRMIYISRTSYYAAQGELKWALNEGFRYVPDVALRAAYTHLFGQKDWNLGTTDLDFMISKRFGLKGVTSLTPYVAARYTFVMASSDMIDFDPAASLGGDRPAGSPSAPEIELTESQARFPSLRAGFYRTTVGVRFTTYAVSLALEGTYLAGSSYSGKDDPAPDEYPDFEIASSFGAAFKLGWEF